MDRQDKPCSECERLRAAKAKLEARVAELERQLEQKSRASKRQAAPFAKPANDKPPKKPGRKAGEQHGQHAHRPPPAPDTLDEVLEAHLPDACPHCQGALQADDVVDEQFQTDLPTTPIRRKFLIHKGTCTACGRRVRGRHPLQTSDATGAAQSQLGPNAQASIIYLNKQSGLSYGKIANFFQQTVGLDFLPSTATRIVLRAGDKLEPAFRQIETSIQNSGVLVPDETGWRVGGLPAWLHVAVGEQATWFAIHRQRSARVLEELIGRLYSGILVHDGFASYDRFEAAAHQSCVAHVLRRAVALEETLFGRHRLFPRQVIDLFQEALALRDQLALRALAGPIDPDELEKTYLDYVSRLCTLTAAPRVHEANARFARHLHRHAADLLLFLAIPGLPATNFLAEQALRGPIVNRKVFGGNRTWAGAEAQAILSSVLATCRQQSHSGFEFLRASLCGLSPMLFRTPTLTTP